MEPNWQLARKRPLLEKRARITQAIRAFFIAQGFLEVETPQRIPANAPELHIDAFPSGDWFLHNSPELAMKRLLAAGYDKIFQICHCWRAGERGTRHLPEYTMLEWYRGDTDYRQLMEDCEALLTALCPEGKLVRQGETIDLQRPWPRLTVRDAFEQYSHVSLDEALATKGFDDIVALQIEPQLPQNRPVFLIDYPLRHAALARAKPSDPTCAERFELYIAGMELANAFSELTDPTEQRQRFIDEERQRRDVGKIPYPVPENFLRELRSISAAAGIALGVDRLVMLLCDVHHIDDVVPFPPEML